MVISIYYVVLKIICDCILFLRIKLYNRKSEVHTNVMIVNRKYEKYNTNTNFYHFFQLIKQADHFTDYFLSIRVDLILI